MAASLKTAEAAALKAETSLTMAKENAHSTLEMAKEMAKMKAQLDAFKDPHNHAAQVELENAKLTEKNSTHALLEKERLQVARLEKENELLKARAAELPERRPASGARARRRRRARRC